MTYIIGGVMKRISKYKKIAGGLRKSSRIVTVNSSDKLILFENNYLNKLQNWYQTKA